MEKGSLLTLCSGIFFILLVKMDVGPIFFCINLVIMLVIMHNTSCISHYASFGKHSKLSNCWVTSDSLWVEHLLSSKSPYSFLSLSLNATIDFYYKN